MTAVSQNLFFTELRRRRPVDGVLQTALQTALLYSNHRDDFNHGMFMESLRLSLGKVPSALYNDIMVSLNFAMGQAVLAPAKVASKEPEWVEEGRKHIGLREIVGSKHNAVILGFWKLLRRPHADDETPWCGGFVGYCIARCGLKLPKIPERALEWSTWGKPCPATPGAVGVKSRKGGNHVFFIIGETPDGQYFKVLEGNANNMVRIGDIRKSEVFAIRWPAEMPLVVSPLPKLAPGVVSTSEA